MNTSLSSTIYAFLKQVVVTIWRYRVPVFHFLLGAGMLIFGWNLWYSSQHRRIVLFVGPAGSSTAAIGPSVAAAIGQTRGPSGFRYEVNTEQTGEAQSIRERMDYEFERIPIGFVEDRVPSARQDDKEYRVLLPMEWDYLFVICSRDYLGDKDKTLGDVLAGGFPTGRVFLGPENSGSNRLATLVLEKFGGPKIEHYAKGIGDWVQMRTAFKNKELDLAFYSGPIGASVIDELAGQGDVVLLSLGDITQALQYETGFLVYAAMLPENICAAATGESDEFCAKGTKTVATRRVLACPRSLPDADAYTLASTVRSALENNQYYVDLQADEPPFGYDSSLPTPRLRMPPHAALSMLQNGKTPFILRDWRTWNEWARAAVLLVGGLIAIDLLRWATTSLSSTGGANQAGSVDNTSTQDDASSEFATLSKRADDYQAELELSPIKEMSPAQIDQWQATIGSLHREIRDARTLTKEQRALLRQAIHALQMELNLIKDDMGVVAAPEAAKSTTRKVRATPGP